ncbi:ABC transporter permease [Dongia soli]|uniref:ABC transporter permease n=1 Tax=Dongia soli TaxID=600628 RepID=A0ABU5EDU5_9PROT|nr:ABC transporter permease [Dongia soli]MDY0884381.1 ABC transporter permease [Dongia soli]
MTTVSDNRTRFVALWREKLGKLSVRQLIGLTIITILVVLGILAPYLGLSDPNQSSLDILQGASANHWFGTDALGRDVFSRVIHGIRVSVLIGLGVGVIGTVLGVPIGLIAGYARGTIDLVILQVIDLFVALPALVLALIITAIVGSTAINIALVLGFVMWPQMARLVRGQVIFIRESVYVEAARALGGKPSWIIRQHILPNAIRLVIAQFSITVAFGIFSSASLSFLGLGVPPPAPDWGTMVREGVQFLAFSPLMSIAPGAAVTLTVLGFYLLGSKDD